MTPTIKSPIPHPSAAALRMAPLRRKSEAFTLLQVLVFLGIMGVILAMAAPSFTRSRGSTNQTTCVANLLSLRSAQQQWALETKSDKSAPVLKKYLLPFLKNGGFPVCPEGGTYTLTTVDQDPTCSLKDKGHEIKK